MNWKKRYSQIKVGDIVIPRTQSCTYSSSVCCADFIGKERKVLKIYRNSIDLIPLSNIRKGDIQHCSGFSQKDF